MKVLAISGSLRAASYNRKLLQVAKKFASEAGAEVSEVDLKELNLPVYDGDMESQGMPENVKKFWDAVKACDVILLASPEYNYSVPGGLKNAIDWGSRFGNAFDGKFVALFGASNGNFGTVRGQYHWRQVFATLNLFALPQPQVFLRNASDESFNSDGSLKDEKLSGQLKDLVLKTIEWAERNKK